VAEACVRGDSGARNRLFEWTGRAAQAEELTPAEESLLAVWRLPAKDRTGVAAEGVPEGAPEVET
jgi:hypothetical protein